MSDTSSPDCSTKLGGPDIHRSLRIASLFVILFSSGLGAFFPLIAKRNLRLPGSVYEFAKYFGSGVIIATAFIHLLTPAFEELGSECLGHIWKIYPWPAAIALSSVFFIFFIELFAFRWGTARIKKLNAEVGEEGGEGFKYDTHGHALEGGSHAAHGPEGAPIMRGGDEKHHEGHSHEDGHEGHSHQHGAHGHEGHSHQAHSHSHDDHSHQPLRGAKPLAESSSSLSHGGGHGHDHGMVMSALSAHPLGQYLSILILESGIIFHSFIIGLTLAVSQKFIPLFIVVVFHQLFEGLGLGTRLSQLLPARHCHHLTDVEKAQQERLPPPPTSSSPPSTSSSQPPLSSSTTNDGKESKKIRVFPYLGALAFALTTPLGIAIGLGLQSSYDPGSNTANIVSGVLDAFSSGILMYTGLVELLAHEFLFNPQMMEKPLWGSKGVVLAGFEVLLGAGLMSLLGRWA